MAILALNIIYASIWVPDPGRLFRHVQVFTESGGESLISGNQASSRAMVKERGRGKLFALPFVRYVYF